MEKSMDIGIPKPPGGWLYWTLNAKFGLHSLNSKP